MESYSRSKLNIDNKVTKEELVNLTERLYDLTQVLREIISVLPAEQTSILSKKLQERQQKVKSIL